MGLLPDLVREFQGREALVRLLTYAIRCPEVSPLALLKLQPQDFDAATESEFQIVWIAAKAYWEQYNAEPPVQYLVDICPAIMQAQGITEMVLYQRALQLINEIYAIDAAQLSPDYGKELVKAFLGRLFINAVGQFGTTYGDAAKVYELIEGEFRKRHVTDMTELDPFDIDDDTTFGAAREPLGTDIVDLLMSGGTYPSDVLGILGPTGGGKTTLALQIAGGCALRKQRVLYFTYETAPDELRPRLISFISRISSDDLEGKSLRDLDEKTRESVKKAAGACKQHVSLIDRSSGGWSPIEIEERIRQEMATGTKPRLIVIDWLWIPVLRAASESDKRGKAERQFLNDFLDAYKGMATKYNINFLVLQQLSTEQSKKSPGRKPQWFNSAEAGSFSWLLSYCFAIGTADARGYCYIVGSKARHAKKQDVVARLIGGFHRFDLVDSDMTYSKKRGGFIPPGKENSLNFDDAEEESATTKKLRSNYEQSTDIA